MYELPTSLSSPDPYFLCQPLGVASALPSEGGRERGRVWGLAPSQAGGAPLPPPLQIRAPTFLLVLLLSCVTGGRVTPIDGASKRARQVFQHSNDYKSNGDRVSNISSSNYHSHIKMKVRKRRGEQGHMTRGVKIHSTLRVRAVCNEKNLVR